MTWVSTNTGEIKGDDIGVLPDGDAIWIEDLQEYSVHEQSGIAEWLTKQKGINQHLRETIKRQAKVRLAQLDARDKNLDWFHKRSAQEETERGIEQQPGKRKSLDNAYGRCGFRRSKTTTVVDQDAAVAWCLENFKSAAVKTTRRVLTSFLPADEAQAGEIPGVEFTDEEVFYVRPAKVQP